MSPIITRRVVIGTGTGFALARPAISRAQEVILLKLAHTDPSGGARQVAAEHFADRVAVLTHGRYKVQTYPSGQLGTDVSELEQLRLGSVDFAVTGAVTYGTYIRALNLTALPYLVESYEQGWALYDQGKWIRSQFDLLPARGLRILSVWEAGFRSFSTKMALNSPANAAGKKLRIYASDIIRWAMESLGFTAVVLPVTDVYLAIQQGAVVGQENPIDTIFAQKFYEVAPFIGLTQHIYSPTPLSMSERSWKQLPQADQALIMEAAKDASTFSRNLVRAQDDQQLAQMKTAGATINRPDLSPFRAAMRGAVDKARQAYGADLVDPLLADAEAIQRSFKG